jgi:hypothetical protein
MNCVNCGAEVQTSYCPACGQRAGVKRLIFRDTITDLWNNLAGFDGIFSRTLKDLTRSPGKVANAYIAGVRVKYIGPIGYFFFMITLLLLWIGALGIDFADLIRDRQEDMALVQSDRKGLTLMTQWIGDNIKWFLFLAVPFQAVAARVFFFRRSGYNVVEHAIPLFYASGHLFWLTMVSVLLKKLNGELFSTPVLLLTLAYFGFMYADLMKYQSRVKAFFKGLGVYLAGQLLFVATVTLLVVLFLLALSVVDPEALDLFRPSGS